MQAQVPHDTLVLCIVYSRKCLRKLKTVGVCKHSYYSKQVIGATPVVLGGSQSSSQRLWLLLCMGSVPNGRAISDTLDSDPDRTREIPLVLQASPFLTEWRACDPPKACCSSLTSFLASEEVGLCCYGVYQRWRSEAWRDS